MKKLNKKVKIVLAVLLCICVVLGVTVAVYVGDYYKSEDVSSYLQSTDTVAVTKITGVSSVQGLFFDGKGTDEALIFYPGAKVEAEAYAPLLYQIAAQGIDCFLVDMPLHLAILGINKADAIRNTYSYKTWYMGGHSMGGAMAASYVSKHLDAYGGVLMLAAYPVKSLNRDNFKAVMIYGSADSVVKRDKIEAGKAYMPEDFVETVIDGGNHAGFAYYGPQKGDGQATISRDEQIRQTVDAFFAAIGR